MAKYLVLALCLAVVSTAGVIAGGRSEDPLGVAVSPQTLLLNSDQSGTVVVHTDGLPYSSVARGSVKLNGVPAIGTGADACGDLVASFDEKVIKGMVQPPSAVLTLTGEYTDGTTFSGSDTVRVVAD